MIPPLPDFLAIAEKARQTLEDGGWRLYRDVFRDTAKCYYKRFQTPTRCHGNDDKPGIQVCVALYGYDDRFDYEIELSGELPDGTWIKLHNWAMPPLLEDGLALIPRMIRTWEFIANDHE